MNLKLNEDYRLGEVKSSEIKWLILNSNVNENMTHEIKKIQIAL